LLQVFQTALMLSGNMTFLALEVWHAHSHNKGNGEGLGMHEAEP